MSNLVGVWQGNTFISAGFKRKEVELNLLHIQLYDETLTVFIVEGPAHSSSFLTYISLQRRTNQLLSTKSYLEIRWFPFKLNAVFVSSIVRVSKVPFSLFAQPSRSIAHLINLCYTVRPLTLNREYLTMHPINSYSYSGYCYHIWSHKDPEKHG
jgi:hypothetical protein